MEERASQVVLRVRGTASTEVPPDFAELTVLVTVTDPQDRSAALSEVAGVADRLRSRLEGFGPDGPVGVEVHLSSVTVQPNNQWVDGALVSEGYVAYVTGYVRCAADDAAEVAEVIVASGVEVSAVRWLLDDDNPARRHVRGLAVADAERAADDYADALGRPRGELIELSVPAIGAALGVVPAAGMAASRAGAAGEPQLSLDPTPVRISESVSAVYVA